MIKALVDTNILLDALASRNPFRVAAERIFLLAAEEKIQGLVTANSITDIYYLVRKTTSEDAARKAVRNLLQLFSIVTVSGLDCEDALDSPIKDYEDALVAICGKKAGVSCIVTRDADFLKEQASPPVCSPDAFLEQFSK